MRARQLVTVGAAMAVTAATVAVAALTATPAAAATNSFRGFNWADQRDNFVNDTLVLGGLSTSDSYATTVSKATAVLNSAASVLGTNTVRIPVNYPTVSGSYWNSYKGIIDAAGNVGYKIILSYWEADNSRDGKVDNTTQWNSMWSTIVNAYGGSSWVYFEPMNEPHGYSDTDWKNLAASWISTYSSVPKSRIVVSGSGYNTGLQTVLTDSRFNGTYVSMHTYKFFNTGYTTESQWYNGVTSSIGSYTDRVIVTEWGADQTTGLNYEQPSSDLFVTFMRGTAAALRTLGIGSVYWPGIRINDTYRMLNVNGTSPNYTVSVTNTSGRNLLQWSWGQNVTLANPPSTPAPLSYYRITNVNSGKVIDVNGQSTANNAEIKQWTWNSGANQKFAFDDQGNGYVRLVGLQSGKCIDVASGSTANGANVIIYTCGSGTNQQWQWTQYSGSNYHLVNRNSGKCLEVVSSGTADGSDISQNTCGSGANQQWTRTAV